jgi:hypothetical protein
MVRTDYAGYLRDIRRIIVHNLIIILGRTQQGQVRIIHLRQVRPLLQAPGNKDLFQSSPQ